LHLFQSPSSPLFMLAFIQCLK